MKQIKPFEYAFERVSKRTPNQVKKHYTQFNQKENIILSTFVSSLNAENIRFTHHSREHIPFINHNILKQIIGNCEVVEFNVTNNRPRLLLRSNKQLNIIVNDNYELAHVCVVIGIKDNVLVSAYVNCVNDKHETLNMDRYTENLDIIKFAFEN